MPRAPRIEYEGACYHVMSRGNAGQAIFLEDRDYRWFLATLNEACEKTTWRLHSYVLMGNHYHLLIETPNANLVRGMAWLNSTWSARFNARHGRRGHLFQGRYKALLINPEDDEHYFRRVADYIHLNPVRAGLISRGPKARVVDYPWSSLPLYLATPRKRPVWLHVGRVLSEYGESDSPQGRAAYAQALDLRMADERGNLDSDRWKEIRHGWYLGDERFREKLVGMVESVTEGMSAESFSGPAKRDTDEAAARQLLKNCLNALDLDAASLPGLKKNDRRKKAIAWKLRSRTTMTNDWVAERLCMGHRSCVTKAAAEFREAADRETRELIRQLEKFS